MQFSKKPEFYLKLKHHASPRIWTSSEGYNGGLGEGECIQLLFYFPTSLPLLPTDFLTLIGSLQVWIRGRRKCEGQSKYDLVLVPSSSCCGLQLSLAGRGDRSRPGSCVWLLRLVWEQTALGKIAAINVPPEGTFAPSVPVQPGVHPCCRVLLNSI